MTTPSEQPSFNSSTYKTFAGNDPLIPSTDSPLSEQADIQAFLNAPNTGPIPENLLYRLLTVAELYLEHRFPEKQLSGLCIGYFLEGDPNFYYVSWGWIPEYEARVEIIKKMRSEVGSLDPSSEDEVSSPSDEDVELEQLVGLIEVELNRQAKNISDLGLLKVFILNHFYPALRSPANLFSELPGNNRDRFTVLLDSPSELRFQSDNSFIIPLDTAIDLNQNIKLNANSESLSFTITRSSVSATASSHSNCHPAGKWKYKIGSPSHNESCTNDTSCTRET